MSVFCFTKINFSIFHGLLPNLFKSFFFLFFSFFLTKGLLRALILEKKNNPLGFEQEFGNYFSAESTW